MPCYLTPGPAARAQAGEAALHDSFIYKVPGREAVEKLGGARSSLTDGFHPLAEHERIPCAAVKLALGDMYFFKADNVHEVPPFGGGSSRVVLHKTYIGWSPHDLRVELMRGWLVVLNDFLWVSVDSFGTTHDSIENNASEHKLLSIHLQTIRHVSTRLECAC